MKNSLDVLFQDNFLLVINKAPGLIVTPSETDKSKTLADILKEDYSINLERGGIVHRLDKDTSGLIVVAKTIESLEALQAQFKARVVKKEYLCLVHGFLKEKGRVVGAIARNPGNREKFMVVEGDPTLLKSSTPRSLRFEELHGVRDAVTEYEPLKMLKLTDDKLKEIFPDFNKIQFRKLQTMNYQLFTLVSCKPKTGRTHQIRVHLKYIGNPIVGDSKYGGRRVSRLDSKWCPRQFLHASKITFRHPGTNKMVEFESPLPGDLQKALSLLHN